MAPKEGALEFGGGVIELLGRAPNWVVLGRTVEVPPGTGGDFDGAPSADFCKGAAAGFCWNEV